VGQAARKPCSSLVDCRYKVAEVERILEVTAPRLYTVQLLVVYEETLLTAIEVIREKAVTGQNVKSRDGLRSYIHKARNEMSLAIVELNNKGVNKRFAELITLCQGHLEQALQNW